MHMGDDPPIEMFNELRGEQLSAVTFVSDCLQLWLNGPGINVTNPLTVRTPAGSVTSWQPGFRDALCDQISKIVTSVRLADGEAFTIHFADSSLVSVSLRTEDYTSPEAIRAHGFKNNSWLVA
jgi:hypothetical protein